MTLRARLLLVTILLLFLAPLAVRAGGASPTHADFVLRVLELTNQERARHGLPSLLLEPALCSAAQTHCQDMVGHNYFSHTGSDGSTVGDRISAAGYSSPWAYGENIAAGQLSPEEVVAAWMNSEGHRANVLCPWYTEIGIAYVYAPDTTYWRYWAQNFASKKAGS